MTKNEVKRLLWSARHADREMERIRERIERLDALRKRVTPTYSQAPGGGGGNSSRIEDITAQIMELEEMWRVKTQEYLQQYKKVEEAVCLVENQDTKAAETLRLRYLDGTNWEDIAAIEHYEQRHVYRLHRQGIKILMANLNIDFNC